MFGFEKPEITMNEFPKEITFLPAPYIGLIGLDAANNTIHNVIWNTFAINRTADRPQLYYKLIPIAHSFPVVKEKVSKFPILYLLLLLFYMIMFFYFKEII